MKLFARLGLVTLAIAVVFTASAVSYEVGKSSRAPSKFGLAFTPSHGSWTSNDVPIKTCVTSYGVNTPPIKVATKQLRMKTASTAANELNFYTDSNHLLTPILGPAGWNCAASQGSDGTSSISIYPPGVKDPGGAQNGTEETMGIEETFIPACQGCIADLECPVFLNAETQLGYNGQYCPSSVPSTESVRFLEGNAETDYGVAVLNDPPGSLGTVALSGGDYPATGALLYLRMGSSGGQATGANVSCVLPLQDETLCTAIVNNFVSTMGEGA